jgi:hypothetical protein
VSRQRPDRVLRPVLNNGWAISLQRPDSLQFSVTYSLDTIVTIIALSELKLQPIDLVYLTGDQSNKMKVKH